MSKKNQFLSFGVEEEYLLLDKESGLPADCAAEIIRGTPELGERTEHEYFTSQLETSTPICHEAAEAEGVLSQFRVVTSQAAANRGVVLAGTGLPPIGGETAGTVTPRRRYRRIETEMRGVAENQYATGTHVHVEVPSDDLGIEVLDRLARWSPMLLALTANSPLWCGQPIGFASWRHIMGLTWPVAGYPSSFDIGEEYEKALRNFSDNGVIPDTGLVSWVVRLSTKYPTIEVRIADSQLAAADSVALAVIVRAIVSRSLTEVDEGLERPRYTPSFINGANWLAARNGLGADLIDPLEAETLPAFDLLTRMLGTVEAELDRFGDRERVENLVCRLRETGGPAKRQLDAFEAGGVQQLLELYSTAQRPKEPS